MLLRRVLGGVLRARRQNQHRTLREVSTAAKVSLGYLSEIERGQKEASSELLAAICEALGSELSDVLRDATESLAGAEQHHAVLPDGALPEVEFVDAGPPPASTDAPAHAVGDGAVSVSVRRDGPLRTTLHAVRARRPAGARTRELTRPGG